jgi:hypothetical protein
MPDVTWAFGSCSIRKEARVASGMQSVAPTVLHPAMHNRVGLAALHADVVTRPADHPITFHARLCHADQMNSREAEAGDYVGFWRPLAGKSAVAVSGDDGSTSPYNRLIR